MGLRPSWDEYFIQITELVASRSTCLRRSVGAVIVKNRHILATGYNGAPSGISHCAKTGCIRARMNIPSGQRHELCRGTHAEQNGIVQAAKHGTPIEGATIYVNTKPCSICSKMIINSGIKRVCYLGDYSDKMSEEMMAEAGIEMVQFNPPGDR